jgi:hypothetical protein
VFVWRWDGWGIATFAIICGVGLHWASGKGQPQSCGHSLHAAYVTGRSATAMTGFFRQGAWSMGWSLLQLVRVANLLRTGAGVPRFPAGGIVEFAVAALAALAIVGLWTAKAWEKPDTVLRGEFRSLAPEPLPEPGDPRLKRWQPGQPFA